MATLGSPVGVREPVSPELVLVSPPDDAREAREHLPDPVLEPKRTEFPVARNGDVRANENIALTATHTLFAREHNRIVSALPRSRSAEERFEIARRIVGAEQQYITYTQFLPALGVRCRRAPTRRSS